MSNVEVLIMVMISVFIFIVGGTLLLLSRLSVKKGKIWLAIILAFIGLKIILCSPAPIIAMGLVPMD